MSLFPVYTNKLLKSIDYNTIRYSIKCFSLLINVSVILRGIEEKISKQVTMLEVTSFPEI